MKSKISKNPLRIQRICRILRKKKGDKFYKVIKIIRGEDS